MKYNRDGTLYQLDTVLEAIEARCAKEDFPYLSDLLGSDWGMPTLDDHLPETYKKLAVSRATKLYCRK